jgi:hypothetical protein
MSRACMFLVLTMCSGASLLHADDAPVFVVTRTVRLTANSMKNSVGFSMLGPTDYEIVSVIAAAVNATTDQVFPGVKTYITSAAGIPVRAVDSGGKPDALLPPGNAFITCERTQSPVVVDVIVSVTLRRLQ